MWDILIFSRVYTFIFIDVYSYYREYDKSKCLCAYLSIDNKIEIHSDFSTFFCNYEMI